MCVCVEERRRKLGHTHKHEEGEREREIIKSEGGLKKEARGVLGRRRRRRESL